MKPAILLFTYALTLSATTLDLDTIIQSQPAQTVATVILDAQSSGLTPTISVCDKTQFSICWNYSKDGVANTDKQIIALSLINAVNLTTRYSIPTNCSSPCVVMANLNWGRGYAVDEEVTNSGTSFSPKKISSTLRIPPVFPAPLATNGYKLPMEIIGQDEYQESVQFAVPSGAPTTSCYVGMWLNNQSYQTMNTGWVTGGLHKPYDGKLSFQIWSSWNGNVPITSTNWINVNNTNSTTIDESGHYGIDAIHAIGSPINTIEVTIPIPDNSFIPGQNNVFVPRFNGTDGITSGLRILYWWLSCGNATQLTSLSSTSNIVTTSPSIGTTGDIWYIYRAAGLHGQFNGPRTLTSAGQFTTCGSALFIYMIGCTVTDGVYSPPISTANAALQTSYPGSIQPTMWGIKVIAPLTVSYDDPSTYTAPVGGNATLGAAEFVTRNILLNSNSLFNSGVLIASCADCHLGHSAITGGWSKPGSDLAYANVSNYVIGQRTLFHGGTVISGGNLSALDIEAYIRSLPTTAGGNVTVYSTTRIFNPVMQPGPGIDSNPADQFFAGCGVGCVPTYDTDIIPYMQPGGSFSTWAYNTLFPFRDTPSPYQYPDLLHWYPAIHPVDGISANFFISGTSTTSVTIPAVTSLPINVTFTTATALGMVANAPIIITYASNVAAYVVGPVVSDVGNTLVVSVTSAGGSGGTYNNWKVNPVYGEYLSLASGLAANTSTAYKAQASNLINWVGDIYPLFQNLGGTICPDQASGGSATGGCIPPAIGAIQKYSISQWMFTKSAEFMMPNLIGMLDQFYIQETGARSSGSYDKVGFFTASSNGMIFTVSPHITLDFPTNVGAADGIVFPALNLPVGSTSTFGNNQSTSFFYVTNQSYTLSAPISGFGNYKENCQALTVMDCGYIWNFLSGVGELRPSINYGVAMMMILFNQASADLTPGPGTNGSQWSLFTRMPNWLGSASAPNWSWLTTAQQTAMLTQFVRMLNTQFSLYSVATWNAAANMNSYSGGGALDWEGVWLNGVGYAGNSASALLTLGHYFGVNLTDLTTFATNIDSLTIGPPNYEFLNDLYAQCRIGANVSNNPSLLTTIWPYCANLFQGNDHYKWTSFSTLGAAVTATSGVGITFASGTNIPSMSSVQVDLETIGITVGTGGACSGASCTIASGNVVRGIFNTTAATHTNGAAVSN